MFNAEEFIKDAVESIQATVGDERIGVAVSGGGDSAVTWALLRRALRPEQVLAVFFGWGLGHERHLPRLRRLIPDVQTVYSQKGPEGPGACQLSTIARRRAYFREIYEYNLWNFAKNHKLQFIAQGTVKPDVEMFRQGQVQNNPGLEIRGVTMLEPLAVLGKPEVKKVGQALGMPEEILDAQPFPGPGWLLRVADGMVVKPEHLELLEWADEKIEKAIPSADQCFAFVEGEMEDGYVLTVRAVVSADFMVANPVAIYPSIAQNYLAKTLLEHPKVRRALYDITPKPPERVERG